MSPYDTIIMPVTTSPGLCLSPQHCTHIFIRHMEAGSGSSESVLEREENGGNQQGRAMIYRPLNFAYLMRQVL